MKYVSFVRLGETCFGDCHLGKVFELTYQLAGGSSSLKEAIHFGSIPDNIDELEGYLANVTAYDPADITFLPVIPDPGKIFCIGLNYEKHRKETERPGLKFGHYGKRKASIKEIYKHSTYESIKEYENKKINEDTFRNRARTKKQRDLSINK